MERKQQCLLCDEWWEDIHSLEACERILALSARLSLAEAVVEAQALAIREMSAHIEEGGSCYCPSCVEFLTKARETLRAWQDGRGK